MRKRIRGSFVAVLLSSGGLFGTWLSSDSVLAANTTKQECVAANETAQDLETSRKLLAARSSLAVCTAASCPSAVREDCGQRLRDVNAAIPTVVFAAKDSDGNDISDVRVAIDGTPLLSKLDGSAIPLDPGVHRFEFEASGFRVNHTVVTAVVQEGVKERRIQTIFELPPRAPAPALAVVPQSDTSQAEDRKKLQRTIGIAVGGAGIAELVVGAIFGVVTISSHDHAVSECPGGNINACGGGDPASTKARQDQSTASSLATVSTIAFIAGGAFVATGATLYFTAPKGTTVEVGAAANHGGLGISLGGRW